MKPLQLLTSAWNIDHPVTIAVTDRTFDTAEHYGMNHFTGKFEWSYPRYAMIDYVPVNSSATQRTVSEIGPRL